MSYERLKSKGFDQTPESYTYFQAIAPAVLMLFTRLKMPVSTSFLLLGLFADKSKNFYEVVQKSLGG